jgi:hypothetical protein
VSAGNDWLLIELPSLLPKQESVVAAVVIKDLLRSVFCIQTRTTGETGLSMIGEVVQDSQLLNNGGRPIPNHSNRL